MSKAKVVKMVMKKVIGKIILTLRKLLLLVFLPLLGYVTAEGKLPLWVGLIIYGVVVLAFTVVDYVQQHYNLSIHIPLPSKRFTEEMEDGEVRIDKERLQELILYMADLEDYFKNNGFV